MALYSDLLEQAHHLATNDPNRPKQASLRRAASYYALFHFLIDRSVKSLVSGDGQDRQVLRDAVARAFNHHQMLKISKAFGGGNQNNGWISLFPGAIPQDLVVIATTFVDLQQARHEADYDLTRAFTRDEVLALITQAKQALQLWSRIADEPLTRAYMLGLLLNTRQ